MRDALVSAAIKSRFGENVQQLRALEVGSGLGHELSKLLRIGFRAENLIGLDLIQARVERARLNYPELAFHVADAKNLPFANESFDVVMQFTCVMHAATPEIRQRICREMTRVLKPEGMIIWWDLAPVKWRTLLLKRLLLTLRGSLSSIPNACKETLKELASPLRRRQSLSEPNSRNVLLTDVHEVEQLFDGLNSKATRAGVHFDVWQSLWGSIPSVARLTWRKGWFSAHCFATAQKFKTGRSRLQIYPTA